MSKKDELTAEEKRQKKLKERAKYLKELAKLKKAADEANAALTELTKQKQDLIKKRELWDLYIIGANKEMDTRSIGAGLGSAGSNILNGSQYNESTSYVWYPNIWNGLTKQNLNASKNGYPFSPGNLTTVAYTKMYVFVTKKALGDALGAALLAKENLRKKIQELEVQIKEAAKIAADAQNAYNNFLVHKDKDLPVVPEDNGNGDDGGGEETPVYNSISLKEAMKLKYKYNIPMVKSAYYQKSADHLQMTLARNPNWSMKRNGRKMWLGNGGGKGVIQADANFAANRGNDAIKDIHGNVSKFNELYGFRFLYNPMTVSMGWGVVQEVDPNIQSLGLDKSVAIAPGILSSTINFSVYLNRIEDMNHINEQGWRKPRGTTDIAPINPWPMPGLPGSFNDELKKIYKLGTMYDVEYLLSAMYPFQPIHKSTLMGKTADFGWLTGIACELHLGDGLRYRVRIGSIQVEHIMFNERMVPVLSELQISATRYPDIKQKKKKKKK